MSKKIINVLMTSSILISSIVAPTLANADTLTLNTNQQKVGNTNNKLYSSDSNEFTTHKTYKLNNRVKLVLQAHQNLMLYGSNTPGKETYDLRKTTNIVKQADVYKKWLQSKDYTKFHDAWAKLSATEKKLPEVKQVYKEYQAAKSYLKATEATFAYYDQAKKYATKIASKGEKIGELLDSKTGLRQKALATYTNFYKTTGEQKLKKSRREYLNKKYLSVVNFLNASTELDKARKSIYNATKPETVDTTFKTAESKVKDYISKINNYSQTYVQALQNSLTSLKKSASSRKKDFIYAVGNVNSNGEIQVTSNEYSSFASANNNFGKYEVLVKRDKLKGTNQVIKTNKGIVSVATTTASVYGSPNLTNAKTYNAKGVELMYLDTVNEDVVKVKIADTIGYMKMSESIIIPNEMVEGHSYYMNKGGKLYHRIFNQATKSYIGDYVIGAEVGSLKENVKYYSLNGVDFYNSNGTKVTTLNKKNLYHFMDASTKNTKYTANDIDSYLKAVKPDSPIIGEGKNFIEAGNKYGINPILLFALANHESNYGTNELSKTKKNIFSINAIDSDPLGAATTYKTYKESIFRAAEFLTKKYMNPNDWRFQGNYFGNKSVGFNVQYASDPFWGQKVAGHYYRFVQWVKMNGKTVEPTVPLSEEILPNEETVSEPVVEDLTEQMIEPVIPNEEIVEEDVVVEGVEQAS